MGRAWQCRLCRRSWVSRHIRVYYPFISIFRENRWRIVLSLGLLRQPSGVSQRVRGPGNATHQAPPSLLTLADSASSYDSNKWRGMAAKLPSHHDHQRTRTPRAGQYLQLGCRTRCHMRYQGQLGIRRSAYYHRSAILGGARWSTH
jgi:hypothetical protein